jgi:hypothetical protein
MLLPTFRLHLRSLMGGIAGFALYAALLFLGPMTQVSAEILPSGTDIIFGCEGEGCGCTYETNTRRNFVLYKDMHDSSRRLGSYPSGTTAEAGDVFSVVVDPGEYRVESVRTKSVPLKSGNRIHTRFYLGEGAWQAKLGARNVKWEEGDIKLKQIRPTIYKVWTQISVGEVHGYANTFPFEGCLE